MAIIFSLWAVGRTAGEAAELVTHFDGVRWTLSDGTESTLDAGPRRTPPTEHACWVVPGGLSPYGVRDDADGIRMTELGERLYELLRTAPSFENALVGIEVDHGRDDADLAELIACARTGLVVTDEAWQRAGSPVAFEVFRPGMRWVPYVGEVAMPYPSTRVHVPDLAVVGCLGCDQPIAGPELVRVDDHGEARCCAWHPYHAWCTREGSPRSAELAICAACGGELDIAEVRGALKWGAASVHHVHVRTIGTDPPYRPTARPDTYAGKPPGVRRIALRGVDAKGFGAAAIRHELVHDDCPTDDDWRRRLRAAPADDELRLVYADWLEQRGGEAAVVRDIVAVRRGRRDLELALGALDPGWCRDVFRGS